MSLLTNRVRETRDLSVVVKDSIRQKELIPRGARIVVAVSGGPDSSALLHILNMLKDELSLELITAHFEHGLRGRESVRDAFFVEEFSKGLGIPFHMGKGDVMTYALKNKLSIQVAARVMRYEFLEKVRKETSSNLIATAHTADDQAEEILFRIIRGSSLSGLKGIPWKRDGRIVRPLLALTKKEVLDHLKKHNLDYMEDSSNLKETYLRNRIRKRLLPLLKEEFNPSIVHTLNRTADILSEEDSLLNDLSVEIFKKACLSLKHGQCELDIHEIRKHARPLRRRVFKTALTETGLLSGSLRSEHLNAVDHLAMSNDPGGSYRLPGWVKIERRYDKLLFKRVMPCKNKDADPANVIIDGPGVWKVPYGMGYIEISLKEPPEDFKAQTRQFPATLWLNTDMIHFPLQIRKRIQGDRFRPLGMKTAIKLKKFLISRKIPRNIRDLIPLFIMDDKVIAVAGVEIAEPCMLESARQKALCIRWNLYKS